MEILNIILFHFKWELTQHQFCKIQTLLVKLLKQRLLNITKISYVSDGCGGQYKNFQNFLNLCSHKEDFSIEAEWIFFATSHGKSPCDGIGGAVKRHAVKWSLQRPLNNQILDYHVVLEVCIIVFFGIDKEDMVEVRQKMGKKFEDGKMVPSTRSRHHFISQSAWLVCGHQWLQNSNLSWCLWHCMSSLACTIRCFGLVWWTKLMRSKLM